MPICYSRPLLAFMCVKPYGSNNLLQHQKKTKTNIGLLHLLKVIAKQLPFPICNQTIIKLLRVTNCAIGAIRPGSGSPEAENRTCNWKCCRQESEIWSVLHPTKWGARKWTIKKSIKSSVLSQIAFEVFSRFAYLLWSLRNQLDPLFFRFHHPPRTHLVTQPSLSLPLRSAQSLNVLLTVINWIESVQIDLPETWNHQS